MPIAITLCTIYYNYHLVHLARDLHQTKPDSPYYNVLLGSAVSDLPSHQALDKVSMSLLLYYYSCTGTHYIIIMLFSLRYFLYYYYHPGTPYSIMIPMVHSIFLLSSFYSLYYCYYNSGTLYLTIITLVPFILLLSPGKTLCYYYHHSSLYITIIN